MLRAPRFFSDDEEDALMGVGMERSGETADAFLDRFAEIQKENAEASGRYEEEIKSLRQELKKLGAQAEEQNQWIGHVESRAQEMEGKNEALEKENAILLAQLGSKEKEVRGLRNDVKMMEEMEREIVIFDAGGGEGRVKLTPEEANSRIRTLREEIAALKDGIRELKEERDRHGDELEMLWERKEQAEVVEKENVELKKEVDKVRTEYVVLERQLVIEREATRKYEEPAEEKLARVKESPVLEVFGSPGSHGSPPGSKGGEVVVDQEVTAKMEKLAEMIEDMKIKHEKELESLELKLHEATYNIKVKEEETESLEVEIRAANDKIKTKDVEIRKLHDAAAGIVAQFGQLQEQTAKYKEQTAKLKARHEAEVNELTQQISGLQEKLHAKEKELAREKERYEAREKIWESNERGLRAQLAQLEQSDQQDVEKLQKYLQEKEEEIAKLEDKNEKLEDKNDELHKNTQHLQQTVRNYRKGGADLPIRQTIANTQLWAEKNILRDSLENIKSRIGKVDPSEVEKIQPLKAVADELKQTKDRLKKEKEDWAKEDGEITAILRRIDGRDSQEHKHTPKLSRRSSHLLPSSPTEFMKQIEILEKEQSAYITARHEEYTAMNAERPLGGPLTAEEDKRLHKLTREFIDKLPDNPMVAFLGGETPQARRKNQLWALTEKVKRLKIREGQDLHTWLPKLKPTIMEHKRRHAQLMRELHVLEGDAEDIVQQINELTQPSAEWQARGRSPISKEGPLAEESSPQANEKDLRKREGVLRKKEEDIRREIRFAYSRLERLLYNRQLFEHWVEMLEKRLNDEASSLVTQVLLEFELRHLLDKESKEACFCSLFEYFFPTAYESTVLGQGHGHGHVGSHEKGKDKESQGGDKSKSPGPKPEAEAGSASLSGRPRTADLRGSYRGKRIPRDKSKTVGKRPARYQEEDDDDVVVRSRAPARLARGQSFGGRSMMFTPSEPPEEHEEPAPSREHPHHGHGSGHLYLSISPESAKFFREHAYPYICQVMTSLIWFGLLLAIQPRNMFKTFSFILPFAVGLPIYLVQFSRFYLAERGGLLSPEFVARFGCAIGRSRLGKGGSEQAGRMSTATAPATGADEYVDIFEGKPLAGTTGLGIVLPKSQEVEAGVLKDVPQPASALAAPISPELQLRGGGGKFARKSKYKLKEGLTVPEDPEPGSGYEQQQEAEAEPSPEEGGGGKAPPSEEQEEGKPLVQEEKGPLPAGEPKPAVAGKGKEIETEPSEGERIAKTVVPEDDGGEEAEPAARFDRCRQFRLSDPESPLMLHSWPELSRALASEEVEGKYKGKRKETETTSLSSPSISSPRTKPTLKEPDWGEAEWLAQAEERKQEEEASKRQQRSQKWWWRLWFWITNLWASFVQFVSAHRPFSSWTSSGKPDNILPAPPTEPTKAGDGGEDSPPLRWHRTPKWPASSVFPGSQPYTSTTTSPPKFPKDEPLSPKRSFWISFRNFVETKIPQHIVRLLFAIRNLFTTVLVILASLVSRLANFLGRLFSSTIIFLRMAISIPINVSRNLRSRLPAPNPNIFYQIPKINLRLSKLRPPNINLSIPKGNVNVKANLPDLKRRKDQAKASFNRFRFGFRPHLPKINITNTLQEIKNLKGQFQTQIPNITPPRSPSPPTILGSLLSFFVIYTVLTYLACLAERRVWTSANSTWKHAYLRDLELSRIAAVDYTVQQSRTPPSFIKNVFTSSSPVPKTGVDTGMNTAYPGWSPAKVDYRLLYAPTFWNLWYLPGDIASYAGGKVQPAWEIVKDGYDKGIGERLSRFGEDIGEGLGNLGEGIRDFAEKREKDYEDGLEVLKDSYRAVLESLENVWERFKGVGVSIADGIDSIVGTGLRDRWKAFKRTFWDGWRVPRWGPHQIGEKIGKWLNTILVGEHRLIEGSEHLGEVFVPSKLYAFCLEVKNGWKYIARSFEEVRTWIKGIIVAFGEEIFEGVEYTKAVLLRVKQLWRETVMSVKEAREWVRETIRV